MTAGAPCQVVTTIFIFDVPPDAVVHVMSSPTILPTILPSVFGDAAYKSYTCADHIVTGFLRVQNLPLHQAQFNGAHNRVRVTVEWGFRIVTQQWGAVNFKDLEKSGLSSLGYRFLAAILLTNMRTCLNGINQISTYFDCPPPSLVEYLSKPYEEDPRMHATLDIWGAREDYDN